MDKSYAGKYESKIFFRKKIKKLKYEIELFLRQFDRGNDEIIVQKFIKVDIAGVIFTKDSKYNSPYYLINYDTSGKTNLITSGSKNKKKKKQLIIFKEHKTKSKFKTLLDECEKLEKYFKITDWILNLQ